MALPSGPRRIPPRSGPGTSGRDPPDKGKEGAPIHLGALLCATLLACGCASQPRSDPDATGRAPSAPGAPTVVAGDKYNDPLIWLNRKVFAFNDLSYRYALIPLARAYRWATPDPVERGIGNFFDNLRTPVYLANDLLQLRGRRLGRHLARLILNTTLGVAGFFDPAAAWFGLAPDDNRLEDTLSGYGAGYGVYLVLPLLGPADARNAVSRVADYFLDPVPYLTTEPTTSAVRTFDAFQAARRDLVNYGTLHGNASDPYLFFRNLYLQGVQRDASN